MKRYMRVCCLVVMFILLFSPADAQSSNNWEWLKDFVESIWEYDEKVKSDSITNATKYNCLTKKISGDDGVVPVKVAIDNFSSFWVGFDASHKYRHTAYIINPVIVDSKGKRHKLNLKDATKTGSGNISQKKTVTIEGKRFHGSIFLCNQKETFVRNVESGVWFEADIAVSRSEVTFSFCNVSEWNLRKKRDSFLSHLVRRIKLEYPNASGEYGIEKDFNHGILANRSVNVDFNTLVKQYLSNILPPIAELAFKKIDNVSDFKGLSEVRDFFILSERIKTTLSRLKLKNPNSIELAILDIIEQYGNDYKDAPKYLAAVKALKNDGDILGKKLKEGDKDALAEAENLLDVLDKAMFSNPALDFDKILLLKRNLPGARKRMPDKFGFPSLNSHNNTKIIDGEGFWDNEVAILSDWKGEKKVNTLYHQDNNKLITDLELHWNADKLLFSSIGSHNQWHVFEVGTDGSGLQQLTPDTLTDVNHFDACYLPNGDIVFTSDAVYQGLPCENGSRPMCVLYRMDRKTGKIRQLTFEQDSDWCPTVMNNGKLMYLRWEYSDLPHYFSRILMHSNPDGTTQKEYYGSSSFFPNSFFFARPIPEHPSMVVGIAGGHHGISRSGRLLLVDPQKGRSEATGVVHEIPHRGKKVEPVIVDLLVDGVWPQFIHPAPINEKYFIVTAKINSSSLWGIYLVDVFDNMTLIKECEGAGLFDPIPIRKQPVPPVIPDKVREGEKEATVLITDIYEGPGLKDIPRGDVKSLRLFSYHFSHLSSGGHNSVGVESGWDIKRVLGTVPVEKDGSASFKVPANMPISIQPLDSAGRSLQLMRSWFVGMPGEIVSCIGCHEDQNSVVPNKMTIAARKKPDNIQNWRGNPRPFSFRYEVQPVLGKYCVSCHDGSKQSAPDFRRGEGPEYHRGNANSESLYLRETAYMNLHPFVRRPGPESDMHVLRPMEYHASTSELVQMLQRGHHNVKLDDDAWERLYAWIDLNAPYRGKWTPPEKNGYCQDARRKELTKRYANVEIDPEAEFDSLVTTLEEVKQNLVIPEPEPGFTERGVKVKGWPIDSKKAIKMQEKSKGETSKSIDLGDGVNLDLCKIPKGEFVMGNPDGYRDEKIVRNAVIEEPFWMSRFEITNEIYALFDKEHDSRFIAQQWKDHTTPGYPANKPQQPVIRVNWHESQAFCDWLSKKTGMRFELPTEEQWEWACRAGSDDDMWYGSKSADFSDYENFSDHEVRKFAVRNVNPVYIGDNDPMLKYYAFTPRIDEVNDGNMIVSEVGQYKSNLWGLFDMHGNVAEWTKSSYKHIGTEQDKFYNEQMKVVKGGSWRDRPKLATSGSRRYYEPFQKVYNVGFRIVVSE